MNGYKASLDMKRLLDSGAFLPKTREKVEATRFDPVTNKKDQGSSKDLSREEWLSWGFRALDLMQEILEGRTAPN